MHAFDQAIALAPQSDGAFLGQTTPEYQNMIGPFGGITAATLLNAVMQHADRLGEPMSMTINFAGPVPEGPFRIRAKAVRTNRSTQHWVVEQWVTENGADTLATTATVITAVRKPTWCGSDSPAPVLGGPSADQRPMSTRAFPVWFAQYAMVPLLGALPAEADGRVAADSLTRLWVRHAEARALDFCSLVAACDVFYPRVWLKRALRVPAGTVSMTVYFHANQTILQDTGSDYLLAQARGQEFRDSYADQTGQVWNSAGTMLATTHQVAYYKE